MPKARSFAAPRNILSPFAPPFSIRPVLPKDFPTIDIWTVAENMGTLSDYNHTLVAEDMQGQLAGFIRCKQHEGEWYVFPVVTHAQARGMGVGRLLMDAAFAKHGPLKFVARGYAVPFYERLGCTEVLWSEVADDVVNDCYECDMLKDCHPLPMRYDGALASKN